MNISVGDYVCYRTKHSAPENGIVKELVEDSHELVRVVYRCDGDWDNYQNYTSALTPLSRLSLGWWQ